ncbi:MAG: RagB/SusD family nutrient uptake outer membrane protein [Phaeodactylibacter sp.]|nr:RagB/SusD family nutrient uptake outer membrane protein [Phaeodactylibacter sp.]
MLRYALSVIALMLPLFSCTRWVELTATDTLLTQEAFDTRQELESALTGAYSLVRGVDLGGRNWLLLSDLMAGNASLNCCEFQEFTNLQASPFNSQVEALWAASYRAVNQLNQILAAVDAVAEADPDFSVAEQERIKGEALFLRAAIYFQLVQYFSLPYSEENRDSMGVPLVLEPVLDKDAISYPPRASIGAVYAQIEEDLQQSRKGLPDWAPSGKPGKSAATAYLAKVAFQQRRWVEADSWAEEVLNSYHQLAETPQDFFREEGSSEEIWCTAASADNPNYAGLNWAYSSAYVHPDLVENGYQALLFPRHQATLEAIGYRAVDLRSDTGFLARAPLLSADFTSTFKYEDGLELGDDAPLLRLAEILLIRAETAARLGQVDEAIELLNQIRRRAFRIVESNGALLPDSGPWIDYQSQDFSPEALLAAIARERRVELAFEGNYLHDLTRRRQEVRPGVDWNHPRLRLPIPQGELDANPNLAQNPGY